MIKKSKILVSALMLCVLGVVYTSCKSDDDSNTPPKNVLCDGNGMLSYFPLDSGNTWGYQNSISGVIQTQIHPSLKIIGTKIFLNKRYFFIYDLPDLGGMIGEDFYLREETTNHNIYRYNSGEEYLEVPGSPTLNQSWTYVFNSTRKVTNLSASKVTPSCSYTGLLEITETSSSGNYVELFYYKKGLGIVYKTSTGLMGETFKLTSGVIK